MDSRWLAISGNLSLAIPAVRQEFERSDSTMPDQWRRAECHVLITRADLAMREWGRARREARFTVDVGSSGLGDSRRQSRSSVS
jgi:hypothetical protein